MSPSPRDPWVLLGVDRDADDGAIKKAYRAKARKYHPDRNPGDAEAEARFQEIARAYEQISNEAARDRWLTENENPFAPLDGGPSAGGFPPYAAPGPDAAAPRRQVSYESEISFAQAFSGAQVELLIEVEDVCSSCAGSGAAPGHRPRGCSICGGRGKLAVGRLETPCSACQGRGFVVERPCGQCDGGIVRERRPFVVQIPAGVADGHQLRVQGPDRGRLGRAEIIVTIRVGESPVFKRELADKAHLVITVPISFAEATLGARVRIPTPARDVYLRVPPGTASAKMFRIAGAGMPRPDGGEPGHLYARVQVVVPEAPSREQRRLIEQLAREDPADLRYELFNPHANAAAADRDG